MASTAAQAESSLLETQSLTPPQRKALRLVSRAQAVIDMCAENPETIGVWPLPIKRALDVLTFKQRHFAINVASGLSHIQAYRSAYDVSEKREDRLLYGEINEVLYNQRVSNAVELLRQWLDTKWLLENGEGIDFGLSVAFEIASTSTDESKRLRAAETILRANGAFVSRSEVVHRHVNEDATSDKLIEAIGSMLGLAAAKATERKTLAESPVIEVAVERVSSTD